MPEGAEVKRCGDLIRDTILGKTITSIKSLGEKGKFQIIKGIENLNLPIVVRGVSTHGKVIMISVGSEGEQSSFLVSTLGMNGWWYPPINQLSQEMRSRNVYYMGESVPVEKVIEKALKHARIEIECSDGTKLLYVDSRNFGNFTVESSTEVIKRIKGLGTDLLYAGTLDLEAIACHLLKQRKYLERPIGEVIVEQGLISGLGNIYRAETLYIAGVYPFKPLKYFSIDELMRILRIGRQVLTIAYEGQSNMLYPITLLFDNLPLFHDKLWAGIPPNVIPDQCLLPRHLVYGQKTDIFGHQVLQDEMNGRTCWWVKEVQT